MNTKKFCKLLSVLALASSGITAHAWGFEAHRMVANLTEPLLNASARSEVQRLLNLEPGATLASVATWADENRSQQTAPWHYVNLPEGNCTFAKERDCPDGACVVEALTEQTAILKSTAPDSERLLALKYIVHLVGDVHQPLHAGYASDKGGNTFQLQAFGQGTNLHALWDTGLLNNWPGGPVALQTEIAATLKAAVVTRSAPNAAQWAVESCKLVGEPGFYPDGHVVGNDYLAAHTAAFRGRIKVAAERLAAVLNSSL